MKELKASNALLNKKLAEERRVERERLKKERKKEKERKAKEPSNKPVPKNKRVKKCSGGASSGNGKESPPALPPKITSRGRNITIPKKFR
ncbi:hypothetical protein EJ02DRAFT_457505 [Clathrospora elynae]|uniref:Uncharacterized protein n=1 Tax=Clathrospora elynae TaxID=706981 RepID=A0A6A5SDV3_9PLEO|nr:hypothetical protein EJ02DRAFT_457505 [Clathrospora elynae]